MLLLEYQINTVKNKSQKRWDNMSDVVSVSYTHANTIALLKSLIIW